MGKKTNAFLTAIIVISISGVASDVFAGKTKSIEVLSTACVYGKAEILVRNSGSVDLYKSDWDKPTIRYVAGLGKLGDEMKTPEKIAVGELGIFEHRCDFDSVCDYLILVGSQAHRIQISC